MKAALDVHYDEGAATAVGAAVVFDRWEDGEVAAEYTASFNGIQDYIPGKFYQRELPCLLGVLNQVAEPLDCVLIDGYVWLGERPGLGVRLWDAFSRAIPIIGIAKSRFRDSQAVEVFRGKSKSPLYITSAGIDVVEAAANVKRMAGNFRIPMILKRVDRLARTGEARNR